MEAESGPSARVSSVYKDRQQLQSQMFTLTSNPHSVVCPAPVGMFRKS